VRVGFKLGQVNRWGYTRHRAGAAELVFAAASSAATADWQPAAAQQRN